MRKVDLFLHPRGAGASYTVKAIRGRSTASWRDFHVARLPISVGKTYHEGGMLDATVNWCIPRFSHVQVYVDDTIQRFNIMFEKGLCEADALAEAVAAGDAWVRRNGRILDRLPSHDIVRSADWSARPEFPALQRQVGHMYGAHDGFRALVDETVRDVWARRSRNFGPVELSRRDVFFDLSRRYILEELAIYALRFEELHAICVYPGTALNVTTAYRGNVPEGLPVGIGKRHFCSVKLSRGDVQDNRS